MGKTFEKKSLTLSAANRILEAAINEAKELSIGIAVMIVDESGLPKLSARMDNAPLMSIDVARKKAVTAVGLGLATGEDWHNFIIEDPILHEGVSNIKDFILLGGGVPIMDGEEIVGAIGISGGHYSQDEIIARKALKVSGSNDE